MKSHHLAFFISPHGYGHAARAAAVMDALRKNAPRTYWELFTLVPRWFFENSLTHGFNYHSVMTDIGLAQKSPIRADISETVRRLDHFMPLDRILIHSLAETISELGCKLVVCDISPLGIAVGKEARIPTLLIENFTWDWIYQEYVEKNGGLERHIHGMSDLFDRIDYHIQTEPVCRRRKADLTTSPISRMARSPSSEIREELKIPKDTKVVMITMGGIPETYPFLDRLAEEKDLFFVIPGASSSQKREKNLILLPHHSDFFHPDLVHTADALIGKVGYSTLAEVYYAGIPFGYVARKDFRESAILSSFIESEMSGFPIEEKDFYSGAWVSRLTDLLNLPRIENRHRNGAFAAAEFILSILEKRLP
jgi:UDP:flavonoid glycosyltransferase YjiC (YdhE family)